MMEIHSNPPILFYGFNPLTMLCDLSRAEDMDIVCHIKIKLYSMKILNKGEQGIIRHRLNLKAIV